MEIRARRLPRPAVQASACALAVVGLAAIGAGSAEAGPLHASFDDAELNVRGGTFGLLIPPSQASLQGADVTGGVVTIPSPSGLSFPTATVGLGGFNFTYGVTPSGTSPITGTLGSGGELSLQPHTYRATITVGGGPTCTYDADLAFNTANPSGGPFAGDPFLTGPPDTTLTQGTLETHWNSLPPDPQPGCNTFNDQLSGPGGLALINHLSVVDPTGKRGAALRKCKKIKNPKKRKKCKKRARRLPA